LWLVVGTKKLDKAPCGRSVLKLSSLDGDPEQKFCVNKDVRAIFTGCVVPNEIQEIMKASALARMARNGT